MIACELCKDSGSLSGDGYLDCVACDNAAIMVALNEWLARHPAATPVEIFQHGRDAERAASSASPVTAAAPAELTDAQILRIAKAEANGAYQDADDCDLIAFGRALLAAAPAAPSAAAVAESQRIAELEAEVAALRDSKAKLESGLDVAAAWLWRDGPPPHPWKHEWFIARTIHGERVVLRALEEDHSYDYTTADGTYMKERNITKWAQFPDSEYIAPRAPAAPVPAASEGWKANTGMQPVGSDAHVEVELRDGARVLSPAGNFRWSLATVSDAWFPANDIVRWRPAAPATSDKAEGL